MMSYDLSLRDKAGEPFQVQTPHIGGTMPIGGYYTTEFNITYNYSLYYYKHIDKEEGLRWLYGKTGKDTINRLSKAILKLGTKTKDDYWEATSGNASAALVPLLEAAKAYPDGIWDGD